MPRPHFIVSSGRCGSTLLSEIVACHPEVLSLSECMANFRPDPFPAGQLTASEFWGYLSRPRGKLSLLLRHRLEASEIKYPVDAGMRFDRSTGLPPLSATCLPLLFDDPDGALDEIERDVSEFPPAPIGDHFQLLFDRMSERMGRGMWIERSGGSLAVVGSLIANFPSARFVHLYRDGPACALSMSQHSGYRLEVLASMLERELGYDPYERPDLSAREHVAEPLRSMLPSEFNADAFRTFEIPLERFGRMWSAIVLRGTRSLAALPAEDVLHLSYETLLVEPATQIERLLEFLALEPPDRSWLAEASGRVRAPADVQAPPDLALARACESGMRRLRTLAGPGSNGAKRESAPGPAAPRARRRAVADLPPGPSEGLASLLGRFLADPERVFSECHERFGDCFTLPLPGVRRRLLPSVVVSDPDAIRELFASGPALSTVVPSRFIMASTLGMESTFLLDDDVHFARRRMISAYFHHEPLKRWQQLAAEIAEREVAAWPLDQPIELGPLLYGVVLEIILQVVLGDSAAERLSEVRALVPGIWGDDGPRSLALRSGAPGDLPSRHAVDQLLSAEVQARREASGNGHADVLSALLEPRGEQAMLTDVELRDELVTLLLAGHENSAAGMAWTFELLLRHPEALERARRDAIGGDGTYLDAVLREAMRCKPPVMFVNRTLRRPWEVLGHRLPAGTDVAACIYLVHQRPELYPEPECFRPERFLDGEPPRFSWLAFGGGLRRCLGAAFAEVEMREVLRAVLSRTEPELVEPGPLPPGTWRSVVMRPSGATRAVLRSQARIGDER